MKKILLSLLTVLLFSACQKEISNETSEEIAEARSTICHYDAVTGISKTIKINANALAAHLAHGDLQGDCSTVLTIICDQDWMVKNLDVDHYRNGDPIPQVTDQSAWIGLKTGAWCYYNNDPANGAIYGKLYNWYAVSDPRGLAPVGWHVPSYDELTTLRECLGGLFIAGGKMKATTLWNSPNTGATNESGFTGLPGGNRSGYVGTFSAVNEWGYFWSSTEYIIGEVWLGLLRNFDAFFHISTFNKTTGLSVRCIRD
jgi:uncharacterized protein (TIGR02145 family)